jgi:hypothetical protein
MLAFLPEMSGLETVFAGCAIVGGVLFILRVVLMFMGADFDADGADGIDGLDGLDGLDGADGLDAADADFDADVSDTDYSFKLLSLQGITAFFMMFGLVGWAMIGQSMFTPVHALAGAAAAGAGTIWLMKKIFEMALGLQASGNIKLKNAVGAEGTVYLTIRPGDTGQVQVNVQNHLKIFSAKCDSDEEIKTDEPVRVVRVMSGNILIVEKID